MIERWLYRFLVLGAIAGSIWWYGGYLGLTFPLAGGVFFLSIAVVVLGSLLLLRHDRSRAFRERADGLERDLWRRGAAPNDERTARKPST